MKHLKKIILAFVCVFTVASLSAMAMDFDHANVVTKAASSPLDGCTVSFDLNTRTGFATFGGSVTGDNTVTKSRVSVVVQKSVGSSWVSVPGTYVVNEDNSRGVDVSGSKYLEKGYYYRVQTENTVWVGSKSYTELHYSALEDYT
ncbi:hypothetical protein LI291_01125 [Intestinibacillus massiliensis]|nr:hypothetical protein [Intestinibacillus massiliensis]